MTTRWMRAGGGGVALGLLAACALAGERPEVWRVGGCGTVTVTLPAVLAPGEPIYISDTGSAWRKLAPVRREKAIVVTLTPDLLRGGSCYLLIHKPKGIELEDSAPPQIAAPTFDGDKVEGTPNVFRAVRTVSWRVTDAQNPLDAGSARVELDGRPVRCNVEAAAGGKAASVSMAPGDLPKGRHLLSICIADQAVVPNRASAETRFVRVLDVPDLALRDLGTSVRVDSRFEGYDRPELMIDGDTEIKPGTTHGYTWASAETAAPHWVELTFRKPVRIAQVYIHWSRYRDIVHTSRAYQIQRRRGDKWETVLAVKGQKPADPSVHRLAPFEAKAIRIWQPADGGCAARPHLMWIREIEVLGK